MTVDQAQTEAQSDFPEAWRPAVGDTITGTLTSVELIDPGGNGPYPCVTLQTSDGQKAVHAFHSVLRRELARRAPKIGDELTINYQGQREGGRNGQYHSYRVRGGQVQDFDWSQELPPEERQDVSIPIASSNPTTLPAPADDVFPPAEENTDEQNFGSKPPF